MKILNILNEQFGEFDDGMDDGQGKPRELAFPLVRPSFSVNDLTIGQVSVIKRLSNGSLNVETASDKDLEVINDLTDLEILDDDVEFTELGNKIVSIITKNGGSAQTKIAGMRDRKLGRNNPQRGDTDREFDLMNTGGID